MHESAGLMEGSPAKQTNFLLSQIFELIFNNVRAKKRYKNLNEFEQILDFKPHKVFMKTNVVDFYQKQLEPLQILLIPTLYDDINHIYSLYSIVL